MTKDDERKFAALGEDRAGDQGFAPGKANEWAKCGDDAGFGGHQSRGHDQNNREHFDGQRKVRIEWQEPAYDRKAIKDQIVNLTKKAAAAAAAAATDK